MRSNKIKNFNSEEKTKIVLALLQEDAMMVQLSSKYGVTSKISQTIKFILSICFCVIVLIASQCDSIHKTNLPSISNEEDLKKNSNQNIAISSTGSYAVVCIGSNNTIHIGTTDQNPHGNQGINPLNNSRRNNQNSIIPNGCSITIESTSAEGTVCIGSNNTVYRSIDTRKQAQTEISHNSSSKENNKEKEAKEAAAPQEKPTAPQEKPTAPPEAAKEAAPAAKEAADTAKQAEDTAKQAAPAAKASADTGKQAAPAASKNSKQKQQAKTAAASSNRNNTTETGSKRSRSSTR